MGREGDLPILNTPQASSHSDTHSLKLALNSCENTLAFGEKLGHCLKGGDVIALKGDLGAGKTLLTQGIAQGLGIPSEQVSSPTFSLIQVYQSHVPVIHVDLYRLEDPTAIQQLGLDDYFTPQNIVIIEWADRFYQGLPPDYLEIQLEHGLTEMTRDMTIRGAGTRNKQIVTTLSENTP